MRVSAVQHSQELRQELAFPSVRQGLQQLARADMASQSSEDIIKLSREELEALKAAFEEGNLAGVASRLQEMLESLESIQLDVGITGETGSGKSSFVNALRGLGDEDAGAARTGVVETTREPTPYQHPWYPNVTIWDLPGIDTPDFHPDAYQEQVGFSRYDIFFIIASQRFTANHAALACHIQAMDKNFYFVRSKVDVDLDSSLKRRPSSYSEVGVLQEIRQNCLEGLRAQGIHSPQVFLLSAFDLSKYDFHLLGETLERELSHHKRHAFLMALPNISLHILEKKKAAMLKQMWLVSTMACGVHATPIPGLLISCDVDILARTLQGYCKSFGLDDDSLEKLAAKVGQPVGQMKAVIEAPLAQEISNSLVVQLLIQAGGKVPKLSKEVLRSVPVLGSMASGALSFATAYKMLRSFMDEVTASVQRVLIKAFEVDAEK
ncbi:interferon-inducible GTPase 5-like [Malaclemys terrapin pileata]|uniref:interferon-inducible GTPase 5-like n=1 Tax=Malaclemys terrapin pileata TaxID=2991368 RepID=UPI0023A7AA32|nr:interferon-inducible GTPase 5-like [Malaclemys terrapin pileata]